jgi:hypothetical protein
VEHIILDGKSRAVSRLPLMGFRPLFGSLHQYGMTSAKDFGRLARSENQPAFFCRADDRPAFLPTVHVTRMEWRVEAETAEEARELLAAGAGYRCEIGDCVNVEVEHVED